MKLVLPLPPNRANAREHWRVTHNKRAAYYAAAQARVWQQTNAVSRGQFQPDAMVRVTATLYVWGRMDDDNAVARLKWALDLLRLMHIIRDDKRPWCRLSGIPEQRIDRTNQRLELVLEKVAA